jgi:hypothetical protein
MKMVLLGHAAVINLPGYSIAKGTLHTIISNVAAITGMSL